jgi:3-hydroxyisobutyrate dehydrogenase-like beta-hydroxyacid dehydrogenase
MTNEAIGWIGVGKMGGPMSRRLVETQRSVMALDPDPGNREAARAAGLGVAASLVDLAAGADTVISTIPNDAALRALAFGPDGLAARLAPGSLWIEMSTVSPAVSAEVAAELARRDIAYLRAPVSGSTAMAAAGTLSVMASGPRAAFDAAEPILAAFSAKRFYVGEAEQARYLKLVINTLVGATASLMAESLALGRKGGLDLGVMLDVIGQSAVASPLIGYKRDTILKGSYEPAFTVEQMIKDFDLITDTARHDHVPMFAAALIRQQYEEALARGDGQKDFFVLCDRA